VDELHGRPLTSAEGTRAKRAIVRQLSGRIECEHIAALLKSPDEVPAVAAGFLAIGAEHNGWLVHGSLPGKAEIDRSNLARAGLDVSSLAARGQLEVMDLDLTVSPEEWVKPWSDLLRARLAAGFEALWFTRFPIGPDEVEIAAVLPFEEAWMSTFSGRPVVTLCPYIAPPVTASAPSHLPEVTAAHDRVVELEAS